MKQPFDYTNSVKQLSFSYPLMVAMLTQIVFWCISFGMLGFLIFLNARALQDSYKNIDPGKVFPVMLSSIIMGLIYGALLGLTDHYFFKQWSRGKSLGQLILIKAILYFLIMLVLFAFIRLVVWELILIPVFYPGISHILEESIWTYYFIIICAYTVFMSLFISFYIQINRKFGPGVLLPLILGKYVQPKVEERAFLFLDLKSSTSHAERLGHVRYSQLIRDCFLDINHISVQYQAEIYQYVGDEMVLCWLVDQKTDLTKCIDFYFACQANFINRKDYYLKKHNTLPEFKAGLHKGTVTGVEVGDIKRELAYHGDTLNVAARIQAKCNEHNADIIISETFLQSINRRTKYQHQQIGNVELKGRNKPVTIYKVVPQNLLINPLM